MSATSAALESLLRDAGSFAQVNGQSASASVAPGASIRALGEPVTDVLLVERGLFEVAGAGEPPRWATTGSMIGLAASLSGAPSPVSVTAVRHGRVTRIPARALWERDGDISASIAAVARLAQLPDHELSAVAPDPLVVAALFESCDADLERSLVEHLEEAVRALDGGRFVRVAAHASLDLADELASYEAGAKTVVYAVRGEDGTRAADIVAHADCVIVLQPVGAVGGSPAYAVACDGTPRRHTELVYVGHVPVTAARVTRRMELPPDVRRVHALPELSATRLELLLSAVRQDAREHESLREFELFASLTDAELAWVHATLRWESIDGGSLLVRQGDVAEDAWLVRAGRLEAVRESVSGERHVSWLGPGAIVGETALLADARRPTSVRAVRDSTVARVNRTTFFTLIQRSATFAATVAPVIATRSVGDPDTGVQRARTFAIAPLVDAARLARFVGELAAAFAREGVDAAIVTAAALDAALGAQASATRRGDLGEGEIIAWLDRLERRHDAVVLVCDADVDSWTRRALRQSDHVLLVADATTTPALRPLENALFGEGAEPYLGQRHLVLLQPSGITEARDTAKWLAARPRHTHHHVRDGVAGDVARFARRITGRAVALALSGASSRAPAHFGVARAMRDHALPIDLTSGSSSGAGVAALLTLGMELEECLAHATAIISAGAPTLGQLQPPLTALTSGAAADRSLQMVYGERQLEDQLIPAVLMAVDIRRHRAVQLTRGPIWKLVRASGSLPVLWPPVWHEDDLLVDGGIINYLPAEVFGDETTSGLVIASNLDATAGQGAPVFEDALRNGTTHSGWAELARRALHAKAPHAPALLDILFHTMAIPSFQQQDGLAALAQRDNVCVVTPPLEHFGLFGVSAETGRALERATWEYAREALVPTAQAWHSRRPNDALSDSPQTA
jgi:predicted acylesterase/phospholipase RssA/CRP-like cAMP-binding protein